MKSKKRCILCGMPLVKPEDYPEGADPEKTDWCVHCGTKDGLYPYSVAVKGMTDFLMKSQGMNKEQAAAAAKEMVDNSEAVKSGRMKKE